MARTVSRKAKGVRRQSAGTRTTRGKSRSFSQWIADLLPIGSEHAHVFLTALILAAAVAIALIVAIYAGMFETARLRIAQMSADAGFEVRHVEVRGLERMNQFAVYERALGERNRAMTNLDLEGLRGSLLQLPYVKDARVSRQLPDGLVVDIVERRPHAVLSENGRLYLIDIEGQRLEAVSPARAQGMLGVAGEGVEAHIADLSRLLEAAPELGDQVVAAEWVGNRRWNLTFGTGQRLALPQGEDRAAGALASFARLDGTNGLLGGQVAAFDMRTPERIYLRVPGRAEEARLQAEGT